MTDGEIDGLRLNRTFMELKFLSGKALIDNNPMSQSYLYGIEIFNA